MSYSQNDEQFHITQYFNGSMGNFIDIGAFHPFKLSNTRRLYELGWSGIYVEPAPSAFKSFKIEYEDSDRIQLLNIAVGDTTGHVKFYESEGDAISTTDEAHRAKWAAGGVPYKEITVPMMETGAFFNEYGKGVNFLSIDTEGTNMILFRAVPEWVWKMISMVCIEHDQCYIEIKGTLVDYGFKEIYRNAENIILCK